MENVMRDDDDDDASLTQQERVCERNGKGSLMFLKSSQSFFFFQTSVKIKTHTLTGAHTNTCTHIKPLIFTARMPDLLGTKVLETL